MYIRLTKIHHALDFKVISLFYLLKLLLLLKVRRIRRRLLLRLRAFADLSFAFCPGGTKC